MKAPKRYTDKYKEIRHSLCYAANDCLNTIREIVHSSPNGEVAIGDKDSVFDDPDGYLCVMSDPIDGLPFTSFGPSPCYVYGLKAKGKSDVSLMVVFSNRETAEIPMKLGIYESMYLLESILENTDFSEFNKE